jgi:hypothetical protein
MGMGGSDPRNDNLRLLDNSLVPTIGAPRFFAWLIAVTYFWCASSLFIWKLLYYRASEQATQRLNFWHEIDCQASPQEIVAK